MSGWILVYSFDSLYSLYYYSFYLILDTGGLPAAKRALGLVVVFGGLPWERSLERSKGL